MAGSLADRRPWPLASLRLDLDRIAEAVLPADSEGSTSLSALELMTIALEDRRFFAHSGVDLRSVVREVYKMARFRPHGGASTIDMQFVRTVTGFRRRKLSRKLRESLLAIGLGARFDKRAILRSYLACAYFGSGLIGADAAAQKLFGKAASALSLDEAAVIAAMLACPRPLNGSPRWEARVARRAAYGLSVFAAHRAKLAGPHRIEPFEGDG